jgi:ABC-2 type transport system ATP-binding protein
LGALRTLFTRRYSVTRAVDDVRRFREILALGEFIDSPVRQLSLGRRMRSELTAALLHDIGPPHVPL